MNLQLWQSEMDHLTERRSALRYKTNIPILFRTFNALEFYSAEELNHSMDGISLWVDFKLAPGVIVQIKHEKCPDSCPGGKACNSCHSTILATIHWCRERNANGVTSYLVGAKYFPYSIGY
jgi:hypothetical protein